MQLDSAIEGYGKMSLWLAPPLMTRVDPETGRPRKIKFGPWIFTAMGIMGKLKAVRGSRLDPFSYTQERKLDWICSTWGPRLKVSSVQVLKCPVFGPLSGDDFGANAEPR